MKRLMPLLIWVILASPARSGELRVGAAAVPITPPLGIPMAGYYSERGAQGVHDDLQAKAIVIEAGGRAAALIVLDLITTPRALVDEARREIERTTRLRGGDVMISATHTHTGPVLDRNSAFGGKSDVVRDYLSGLPAKIAEAVRQAEARLAPARALAACGREDSIAFNRRFLMRDGREITHPGKPGTPHHAEIVAPAGPTDPEVGVLAFRHPGGKVAGVVVNFTCHCTVNGGDQFSPDYVGPLRQHLRAAYGEAVPVCFLQGACGDVTQVDNRSTARESGPEYADLFGRKLAAEVVRVVNRAAWLKEAKTAAATVPVTLAIRPDPDPDRERPAFGLGSGRLQEQVYAREREKVAELRRTTPTPTTEVQALRVGPLAVVTNGAEYFCEYGLRIKQCSPVKPTWFVGYANDYLGYVPTAQAFVAGGYEPRTARNSRFAIDTGQRLVEGALAALAKVAS
jgi:neutral ceramidase